MTTVQDRFLTLAAARLSARPGDFERLRASLDDAPQAPGGFTLRARLRLVQMGASVGTDGPARHDAELLAMIDEWAGANVFAPVVPLPAPPAGALPTPPGPAGAKWTPERKAQARAMREQLKRKGHRDYMARTAEHFGVKPARLRKVLGPDAAHAPPRTLADWPARKVHRLK